MSFETDFDTAFTILLGKAAGVVTPTGTTTGTTTTGTGTSTTTTVPVATGIEFEIDGGGSVITAGSAGGLILPFPILITKVELQEFEGTSGNITIDIQAGVPGNGPSFASICGSAKPTLVGARHYSDDVLSGWTVAIERGTALKYVVTGPLLITRVLVMLYVRRTDV